MRETNGLISSLLTEEQRDKVRLGEESLDSRGVFRRFRVEDQTIFDAFLLMDLIDRHEHEALNCLLADVEKSGCCTPSCGFEPRFGSTVSHKVGDKTASRWMAWSSTYRALERMGHRSQVDTILDLIPVMHDWRSRFGKRSIALIFSNIKPAIPAITKFYDCSPRIDPRVIISRKLKQK